VSVDLYAHDEKDDQRDLTEHFPIIDCLKGRLSTNLYPSSVTKIKAETTPYQAARPPQGRKASANALAA
jgi:biotin--[acetyl-coA-carboxylase] ligase